MVDSPHSSIGEDEESQDGHGIRLLQCVESSAGCGKVCALLQEPDKGINIEKDDVEDEEVRGESSILPKRLTKNQKKRLKRKLAKLQYQEGVFGDEKFENSMDDDDDDGTSRTEKSNGVFADSNPLFVTSLCHKYVDGSHIRSVDGMKNGESKVIGWTEEMTMKDNDDEIEEGEVVVKKRYNESRVLLKACEEAGSNADTLKKGQQPKNGLSLRSPPYVRHRLKPRGSDPHLLSSYCKNGNVADDEYLYTRPLHHYLSYRRKFPNEFRTAGPGETFLLPYTTYIKSEDEMSESPEQQRRELDGVGAKATISNCESVGTNPPPAAGKIITPDASIEHQQETLSAEFNASPSKAYDDSSNTTNQKQMSFNGKMALTTVMTVKGPIELKCVKTDL